MGKDKLTNAYLNGHSHLVGSGGGSGEDGVGRGREIGGVGEREFGGVGRTIRFKEDEKEEEELEGLEEKEELEDLEKEEELEDLEEEEELEDMEEEEELEDLEGGVSDDESSLTHLIDRIDPSDLSDLRRRRGRRQWQLSIVFNCGGVGAKK
ncbi:unnamed protein product [Nippostrongylus brasiliensis]|uniref:Uncharacterized protein n=1 Tax=Nippostrongylus brasiliensis TaxID=27835 RepID=A0A0N4YH43_NIPBR|nr:unnamed protein product [Nippostrongylus brasiliensis]